jgi:prepilin-type N-terminal cleavage/methylation domain-containing protein
MTSSKQPGSRGFTLVELLTIVAIVGILATTAVVFVGRHLQAARTAEAVAMVQSIRAAEERFRAENRAYLSVSNSLTDYHPVPSPDGRRRSFYTGSSSDNLWKLLGPTVSGPVRYGYAVVSGPSGATMPLPNTTSKPNWGTPTGPWYVVQASSGDPDGNGVTCYVVATNQSGEVYVENEGE